MGGMFGLLPFTPRTTPRKNAKSNPKTVPKSSYYLTSADVPHIITFGSYGILATTFGESPMTPCLGDNEVRQEGGEEQTTSSSTMKRSVTTTDLLKSYEDLVNDQPSKESWVLPQPSNVTLQPIRESRRYSSRVSPECRELTMQFSEVRIPK